MKFKKIFNNQKRQDKLLEIRQLLSEQSERQDIQIKKLDNMESMARKIQTKQSKQEDVLEEIFDTIEEHTESFDKQENIRSKEGSMLTLLIAYDESLGQVLKYTGQYEETKDLYQQVTVSMNRMKQAMQAVGIVKIDKCQVPIDYSIHELIDTMDTNELGQKDMVSQIVIPGWSYEQRIVKKANVIAYKYRED